MKTKEDKNLIVAELTETLKKFEVVYIADILGLNAEQTSTLRRMCFKRNIQLQMVKNTLLKKALENSGKDFSELLPVLKGSSAVMLSDVPKAPAALIQEFRKKAKMPVLKGAYVMEMTIIGDDQLGFLAGIKTRHELIADVVLALKSPAIKVAGALKTIADKDAA
ncbi:MAG: 50S ribosomal protein L10 [Bacteroidetes bacterium GWF2_43_63]|nr:MAG: 50S ribosomal protein L10 [Bacteroidetes bacterium GWE2_42_42]OFY55167.1 MAG: 50S ribosomal protein L10 [Bacteroidetes bacterium GWF2_43_63]HBG70210.1 50S ribosomal protein L10 [Bacteroidales bacterium]HCB63117.1 50S ribosomal protein L10 [Bacteroidales bacterium]HCY22664.1 50S ribosomal protein L10 [Bacteroidales bacterium]